MNSPVRKGDTKHTGVTPFIRNFQTAVKSCSQGSVRNGAGTIFFQIFHLEIEDILVLKNNKGTEETRVRHLDYGIQFNKLFYERLIQGGDITLFSPHDIPDVYEAFFNDYAKFKTLYEAAEKNPKLRKKTVKALELFSAFMNERKDTGRIYLMNVDNANTHSSFIESLKPVRQSNLCVEILLPCVPIGTKKITKINIKASELTEYSKKWAKDGTNILSIASDNGDFYIDLEEDAARIQTCTSFCNKLGKYQTT